MGKLIRRGLCRRRDFFLHDSWQRKKPEVYSCLQNAQWVLQTWLHAANLRGKIRALTCFQFRFIAQGSEVLSFTQSRNVAVQTNLIDLFMNQSDHKEDTFRWS